MMRSVEIAAFVTLSGALHVAALTLAPDVAGSPGGGGGGQNDVTLEAATPRLAALVAYWDAPPQISDAPVLTAPTLDAAPDVPSATPAPTRRPDISSLATPDSSPALPNIETRPPAPIGLAPVPAPEAMALPALPTLTALAARPNSTPPVAAKPPDRVALPAPPTETLPQVDTTPPPGSHAPTASARPETRPERRASVTQPARPAQTARGTGSETVSRTAPTTTAPAAGGPSKAQLASAERPWGAQIAAAIQRAQRYPNGTRAVGTVRLQLLVTPSGRVSGVSLLQSSGDRRLDQAALSAVNRARLPRAPAMLSRSSYRFNLPVSFRR